ncbi:hypothetical protein DESC_610291 [Desulfosarcina cetonica]|nr:hypothetical protein DESC_610291 [Desulfosarcina cetonica]
MCQPHCATRRTRPSVQGDYQGTMVSMEANTTVSIPAYLHVHLSLLGHNVPHNRMAMERSVIASPS